MNEAQLTTLRRIADLAHAGGLAGLTEGETLTAIRRLSFPYWEPKKPMDSMADDVASSLAASQTARLAQRDQVEQREIEILRTERDIARATHAHVVRLLTGIHALLYPPPIALPDGRKMVFQPTDPAPAEVLQQLSDRIRALPAELAAISGAGEGGSQNARY